MLRSFRKAAVQFGVMKTGEEDASAKHRLAELAAISVQLRKNVHTYIASANGAAAALGAVHDGMAQVYPGAESLAPALVSLISRTPALSSHADFDQLQTDFDICLTAVDEKIHALKLLVDERAHYREEVGHYKEKLAKLEGRTDPQSLQKMEENKVKAADMDAKFANADAAVVPELMKLDTELATLTGGMFKKFMEISISHTLGFNEQLQQGLAGVPPAAPEMHAAPSDVVASA